MARPADIIRPVDDVDTYMQAVGRDARAASAVLAGATTADKNAALLAMAEIIEARSGALAAANAEDLAAARGHGLDAALLDRLELTAERIALGSGARTVALARLLASFPVGLWLWEPRGERS